MVGIDAVDRIRGMRTDPLLLIQWLWPKIQLYDKEIEIIRSVWTNDKTVVVSGHKLGKDFISALTIICFFLTRTPCRIVTTSVDSYQLEQVLWGEIRRFIQTASIPLDSTKGGPILVNHLLLRKVTSSSGQIDGLSYAVGRVAAKGEGLSGHHLPREGMEPRTLFVVDEASGVDQESFQKGSEWAHRSLIVGNPYECSNDFKWSVLGKPGTDDRGGDIPSPITDDYLRKVIKVKASDSPNVKLGLLEERLGRSPTYKNILPGVLEYMEYLYRRKYWDQIKQCVGLDANFYVGGELLLYPPHWLDLAERFASELNYGPSRLGESMGIDCGQGKANTALAISDKKGLIELQSYKTPDTSIIDDLVIAAGTKRQVPASRWIFDAGGGGIQIAHRLRRKGYRVSIVSFGESVSQVTRRRRRVMYKDRVQLREARLIYTSRRSQMFGELSELLDPATHAERGHGFAIPGQYTELRRQLAPMPKLYKDGKMFMIPKHRKSKINQSETSTEKTLEDLIGCSPDEADALVLSVFGILHGHELGSRRQ